jgi:hypothetical protein
MAAPPRGAAARSALRFDAAIASNQRMKIIEQLSSGVVLQLTADEVVALNNALNESLEHLDDREFETRMGVSKAAVRALLESFGPLRNS